MKTKTARRCECGCGQQVSWCNRWKRYNRYIVGHNCRGKNHPLFNRDKYKEEKEKDAPLCACGCGEKTTWGKRHCKYNTFIPGHQARGENNPMKRAEVVVKMMGENNPAKRPEVAKKISIAMSGENNPSYGKKRPDISALMRTKTGDKNSQYGKYGALAPGWRGGISLEPYCYIFTAQYKTEILDRDNNECQYCGTKKNICGEKEIKLSVHHINYIKKDCLDENLITLCNSCNSQANSNRQWWQAWFMEKMKRNKIVRQHAAG